MRILLAGGTGLVGRQTAKRLSRLAELISLVRRASYPYERAIDFDRLAEVDLGVVDIGISCLGTTIHAAGSQAAFRRVDHDYVIEVARLVRDHGARRFILVSSVGAGGRSFYLSVKGDVEAAVTALGFDRLDILRPGLLLGPRAERRPGERIAQAAAPIINPMIPARYRAIEAAIVAASIARLAAADAPGRFIHHNPEMLALAKEARDG